jgi:hypothetical protein
MRKSFIIDWNEQGGYHDLMKTKSFVKNSLQNNHNLIHTYKDFYVHKKNKLYLESIPFHKWNKKYTWKNIQCKTLNQWMKSSPCKIGTRKKIFLKLKSNDKMGGFGLYLFKLHNGSINKEKHIQFVSKMKTLFKQNPIQNHNEDIDWFHVKD